MHKGLIKHILLPALMAGIVSCENQVDLLEAGSPVPVVYGVISPDDTLHCIRLTKTFEGSEHPEEQAAIHDSLYFKTLRVYLELRTDIGQVLERLELKPAVYPDRKDGMFSTAPNIIYEGYPFQIRQGENMEYHLLVVIPEFDQAVFASAAIPPGPGITTNIRSGEKINLYNYFVHPKSVVVRSNPVFFTEFGIEFRYREKISGEWYLRSFDYSRQYQPGISVSVDSIKLTPEWVFRRFANEIKDNSRVTQRRFSSMSVNQKLISPEYGHYLNSFTYSPDLYNHLFTNIVGGKGLFAAFAADSISGILFSEQMLDSLAEGQYTRHLKFPKWR